MADITSWRVMVVEDEVDGMEVVRDILEHHGIESFAAYSAEEALTMMDEVSPTLMIVDLALPMMDGWGLLSTIQDNPQTQGIPAIAVTAFHSVSVAQEAIRAGFQAYFPKPIEATSFVRELERIVDEI